MCIYQPGSPSTYTYKCKDIETATTHCPCPQLIPHPTHTPPHHLPLAQTRPAPTVVIHVPLAHHAPAPPRRRLDVLDHSAAAPRRVVVDVPFPTVSFTPMTGRGQEERGHVLCGATVRRALVARHAHDACGVCGVAGGVAGRVDDGVVVSAGGFCGEETHCLVRWARL
jgi:hypothetical protein